jgi:hypothetical protein
MLPLPAHDRHHKWIATMDPVGTLKRIVENSDRTTQALGDFVGHHDDSAAALTGQLSAVIEGIENQSGLLNGKLEEIIQGVGNQARVTNDKLQEVIIGLDHQSQLLAEKLDMLIAGMNSQSQLLNDKLTRIAELLAQTP